MCRKTKNKKTKTTLYGGTYLKPYSDITSAGSPFPVAMMTSFSNLEKKKIGDTTVKSQQKIR